MDGAPLWVTVSGTTATALDRQALRRLPVRPRRRRPGPGPGQPHPARPTAGQVSGFDIDQLAFDSAPGGGPMALARDGRPRCLHPGPALSPPPERWLRPDRAIHRSATRDRHTASGIHTGTARPPFDLVLGREHQHRVEGHGRWRRAALGAPDPDRRIRQRVARRPGGVGPAVHGGTLTVSLVWQPQRRVDVAP